MRRTSPMVLLLTIAGLLLLPAPPSSAQVEVRVERLKAEVIGQTEPDEDPHSLGVNRVRGQSEFNDLEINGQLECDDGEIVLFQLAQEVGHDVRFETDDDITDGHGEVHATDVDRAFRDEAATAVRPGGLPAPAVVEVRINEGGRFHRILNYVEVQLRLDIRVEVNNQLICEDVDHEIRIVFLIVGPSDQVTEGFTLVGVARTHELPTDGISLARTVCDNVVADSLPRVSDPYETIVSAVPQVSSTIPNGRDDFHPCGEADQ